MKFSYWIIDTSNQGFSIPITSLPKMFGRRALRSFTPLLKRYYSTQVALDPHTVLSYKYVDSGERMVQKRQPFRQAHLEHVKKSKNEGKFFMGGADENCEEVSVIFSTRNNCRL